MKHLVYSILTVTLLTLSSCVEEFDIRVDGQQELIVIDAMVTDLDTVQTVYIHRERETLELYDELDYPPIEDVFVHIEDDKGWSADFEDTSSDRNLKKGRVFSLSGHQFEPGRTYTITVRVADREFKATETMVPLPDIDGIKFYSKQSKDDDTEWRPILYFSDNQPNTDNYYLFSESLSWIRGGSQSRYVALQRLSDAGFRENLDGIVLDLGIGAEWYLSSWLSSWGDPYYYTLLTISKSNYDYYGVMEDQLETDGGVYKPSPTSPPTNFSGKNVQGQFIAASRVDLYGRLTLDNIIDR
ncbi:MAG: DUF4249 domain-containing protein [Bacteroidales bacterium]|nr:DUF4249 domain-containing protein [Bacteroidales bacterium]